MKTLRNLVYQGLGLFRMHLSLEEFREIRFALGQVVIATSWASMLLVSEMITCKLFGGVLKMRLLGIDRVEADGWRLDFFIN